jgi:hypothetical protein
MKLFTVVIYKCSYKLEYLSLEDLSIVVMFVSKARSLPWNLGLTRKH